MSIPASDIEISHVTPLPRGLEETFGLFDSIVVAELNSGQLLDELRARFPHIPFRGLNKVTGQPFTVAEIDAALREHL